MTECYACAKLAELRAENSALHVKLDELERADVSQAVEDTAERVTNKGEMLYDSREKLEADVRQYANPSGSKGTLGACWEKQMIEFLDRQAAITERHILTHPDERDEQIAELQAKVDELTAEIDALEYVGVFGEQIGRCKACKFAGIHDGKRWPGHEFKGRMYCTAWSDGYMAEWTKPDGFCHMWKPKEGEE